MARGGPDHRARRCRAEQFPEPLRFRETCFYLREYGFLTGEFPGDFLMSMNAKRDRSEAIRGTPGGAADNRSGSERHAFYLREFPPVKTLSGEP